MSESDSGHPDFWTVRYAAARTPWDLGEAPAVLGRFLARAPGRGKVLIPGCGSGYEVAAFHRAGYDVTALDFSPAAVERARSVLGELADKVMVGDFFTHEFPPYSFDFVYERAFLCSMPPALWNAYGERMADLLRPGGQLVGLFLYGDEPDPPPFPFTDAAAADVFGGRFELSRSERVAGAVPMFDGKEHWQEWTRL